MNNQTVPLNKIGSISTLFLVLGFNLISTDKSQAFPLTVFPEDFGWYSQTGYHFNENTNYMVGDCRGSGGRCHQATNPNLTVNLGDELRNFFVFDSSAISSNINSATLRIQMPEVNLADGSTLSGFTSGDPFESYQLYGYNEDPYSIDDLIAGDRNGTSKGQGIFDRLGSGTTYTDQPFQLTNNDNGTFVNIPLNTEALDAINSGGRFAFGGAFTELDSDPNDEFGFAYSNPSYNSLDPDALDVPNRVQLILDIAVNAESRGFYTDNGYYFGSDNYIAGDCRGEIGQCKNPDDMNFDFGAEARNFFTFDLSGLGLEELDGDYDAFLKLDIPHSSTYGNGDTGFGFATDNPFGTENYILANVTTDLDLLITPNPEGGEPGTTIFQDLGTGVFYSEEFQISNADLGTSIEIPLNDLALQDIKNTLGDIFAISGAISTLNNDLGMVDDEYAFGLTNNAFGMMDKESTQLIFRGRNGDSISIPAFALSSLASISSPTTLNSAPEYLAPFGIDLGSSSLAANNAQSTPEPTSVIGLFGLAGLALFGRKKKQDD